MRNVEMEKFRQDMNIFQDLLHLSLQAQWVHVLITNCSQQ